MFFLENSTILYFIKSVFKFRSFLIGFTRTEGREEEKGKT